MTDDPFDPLAEYWKQVQLMQNVFNNACYTQSGGVIYHGEHWGPFAQASSYTSELPNIGAAAQQGTTATQLAPHPTLAQYAAQHQTQRTKPEPIEDAGISVGEIIAYRAWRCSGEVLRSMAVDDVWAPGEPMEGDPEKYVLQLQGCGVHAFKTMSMVLTNYDSWADEVSSYVVVGTIALWGTVIEHELGYRAQFGKVNSLDMICGLSEWRERRMLRRLRQRYGV